MKSTFKSFDSPNGFCPKLVVPQIAGKKTKQWPFDWQFFSKVFLRPSLRYFLKTAFPTLPRVERGVITFSLESSQEKNSHYFLAEIWTAFPLIDAVLALGEIYRIFRAGCMN